MVALALNLPLLSAFANLIPGVDGDVWSYLWAMGWARVALLNLGVNPFHTDYVFYPLGGATQLLWGTALPSFASIPLQLAFGLVPAFNFSYLAASALTGYGMYLLAMEVLTSDVGWRSVVSRTEPTVLRLSSFLAGLAFSFSALRLGYGLAFTNLFHTEFMPFYVLSLLKTTRAPRARNALLAGLFFALNVYIDFQIAAFLALLTGLWVGWTLVRALRIGRVQPRVRTWLMQERAWRPWLVFGFTAGLLSLPMLGFILQDFQIEGGNYIRVYPLRYSAARSYDLLSFVVPNARSTLYQGLPAARVAGVNVSAGSEGETELSPDRQAFLGLTVLVLAILGGIRYGRRMGFWLLLVLVFALLSFGPVLHIAGGETDIPLPFVLLNQIPIANHIRIPMRFGIVVFFGAALLAGVGASLLIRRWRWAVIPIAALILAESAVAPFPSLPFDVPRIYNQIAEQPGDFTVLEIPSFNWRFAARNEVYQVIHQKRILRAYTNRIAPDVADYFDLRQTPIVVRSLRLLEGAETGELTAVELAQDRAAAPATLAFFDLRYVVVHREQLAGTEFSQIDQYLRQGIGARVFYDQGDITGYDLPPGDPPFSSLDLNLADNASLMYLGRGWQIEPLAKVGGEAGRYLKASGELYFDLAPAPTHRLTLRALAGDARALLHLEPDAGATQPVAIGDRWSDSQVALSAAPKTARISRLLLKNDSSAARIAVSRIEIK